MKKYILYTLTLVFIGFTVSAQIDRSKVPSSGPTPEINLGEAKEFKYKNGLTILVVTDKKFPAVRWSLNLNNPPVYEGDKAGVQALTNALLGKETVLNSKEEFNEKIEYLGARVSVNTNGGFAFCLSKYKDAVFNLFAEAALQTKFTQKELDFEKDQLLELIKSGENSAASIANEVRGALFYGKGHPRGEIITKETVNNVTLNDVKQFYNERFKPSNGFMVFNGDITVKEVKKLLKKYLSKWNKGAVEIPKYKSFTDVPTTEVNIVDVPNAVQTELALMNVSSLKMNHSDYHAALVANYILGGAFGSYLNMNLREDKGYTYGVRSSLGRSRFYNSAFRVITKVRNKVTDSAVVESLKEIKRIKTELVKDKDLKNAKAKFLGNFILESEDNTVAAERAIRIKTNNLPKDFYKNFIAKINAVTKEDVLRVAKKYFSDEKARIILVGKGADIIENVEKIKWNGKSLPIKYYDKKANPIKKPVFSKLIPKGITAEIVVKNYIIAIGDEANLRKVNTILQNANVTITGAPFKPKAIIKKMSPNKISMEMMVEGMGTLMKQKFNGQNGYLEQQGTKIPMDDETTSSYKMEKVLFPELFMNASNIELESIATINGKDAYKIKEIKKSNGLYYRYYDIETNYLVRTEKTSEIKGQSIKEIIDFSNYEEINGVKLPKTMKVTTGPQSLVFETKSYKINEGVTTEDFN